MAIYVDLLAGGLEGDFFEVSLMQGTSDESSAFSEAYIYSDNCRVIQKISGSCPMFQAFRDPPKPQTSNKANEIKYLRSSRKRT